MIIQGKPQFLVQKGAELLASATQILASVKPQVVLGVAAGEGVVELLEKFATYDLPWERLHLFLLEEGLDSAMPEQGFGQQLCRLFAQHLEPERLHLFPRYTGDPLRGLLAYQQELAEIGEKFNLILVSCGEQGGIGGLYPNHALLETRDDGYVVADDLPEPPSRRLVAGPALIGQADVGLMLALGPSRATPLANLFDPYLSIVECPAKLLTHLNRYYLLTDQDVVIR